jgi:hypothetical protein
MFKMRRECYDRGLGIPTISDRAYQCLIKYALEPAAEAMFNARSYGFRPGRSCHDVQRQLFNNLRSGGRQVDTIKGFRYADDVVFLLKPEDDAEILRQHLEAKELGSTAPRMSPASDYSSSDESPNSRVDLTY